MPSGRLGVEDDRYLLPLFRSIIGEEAFAGILHSGGRVSARLHPDAVRC